MYILVIVMPDALDGKDVTKRFAARTKQPLMDILANHGDCLAWRMTGKDGGWCDGTENAWKWIQQPYGNAELVY